MKIMTELYNASFQEKVKDRKNVDVELRKVVFPALDN